MPRFVKWSQVVSCSPRFDNCVSVIVCGKLIPKSMEKQSYMENPVLQVFKCLACLCSLKNGWFRIAWLLQGDCRDGCKLLPGPKAEVLVAGPASGPSCFLLSSFWSESNKIFFCLLCRLSGFLYCHSFSPGHHCNSQAVKHLSEVSSTFKNCLSINSGKIVEIV